MQRETTGKGEGHPSAEKGEMDTGGHKETEKRRGKEREGVRETAGAGASREKERDEEKRAEKVTVERTRRKKGCEIE